jgi:hypothetical protein
MPYPPKLGVPRTKQFVIRVSDGEIEGIARVTARSGISRSDYVRDLIRNDLKLQGEKL